MTRLPALVTLALVAGAGLTVSTGCNPVSTSTWEPVEDVRGAGPVADRIREALEAGRPVVAVEYGSELPDADELGDGAIVVVTRTRAER